MNSVISASRKIHPKINPFSSKENIRIARREITLKIDSALQSALYPITDCKKVEFGMYIDGIDPNREYAEIIIYY